MMTTCDQNPSDISIDVDHLGALILLGEDVQAPLCGWPSCLCRHGELQGNAVLGVVLRRRSQKLGKQGSPSTVYQDIWGEQLGTSFYPNSLVGSFDSGMHIFETAIFIVFAHLDL